MESIERSVRWSAAGPSDGIVCAWAAPEATISTPDTKRLSESFKGIDWSVMEEKGRLAFATRRPHWSRKALETHSDRDFVDACQSTEIQIAIVGHQRDIAKNPLLDADT